MDSLWVAERYRIAILKSGVSVSGQVVWLARINARPVRFGMESGFALGSRPSPEITQSPSTGVYCGFAFHGRAGVSSQVSRWIGARL